MDTYDFLIIGAGQTATPLARSLSKAGHRVGIAERKHVGGSCVNFGCTPTKAVISSARVAHQARRAKEFGVEVGPVRVDFPAVLRRARQIVEDSKQALRRDLEAHRVAFIEGHARFRGRDGSDLVVAIAKRVVNAKQVIINTGARTFLPAVEGLADIDFLDAGNWLGRDSLPNEILVLGAGYIGMEMAQFYQRMGARVTVVERGGQVLEHEDPDVAQALQTCLEEEGIAFRLNTEVRSTQRDRKRIRVTFEGSDAPFQTDAVFLATGRCPNTDDLGLETIGVETNDKGVIEVDERLATRVPGVWVAGDVRGGPMFTHASWDDHRVLESQLLEDRSRTTRNRIIPYGVFTAPELGRVGLTEREARQKHGDRVKVHRFDLSSNGRANQAGETKGFIKLIADERDRLIGASVLSEQGADLVASCITLMNAGAPLEVIRQAIYIHPTFAEAVQSALH